MHWGLSIYDARIFAGQATMMDCLVHDFPVQPTVDTLSFYVVFMCHHIKPASVSAYLSGIANTLEPYFPNIRDMCHNTLVSRTLTGMKKLRGGAETQCKRALIQEDLHRLLTKFDTVDYDDTLFLAMLFTDFYRLMHLGELTHKKTSMCHSVCFTGTRYSFRLPYHKGDRLYEGSTIMIEAHPSSALNAVPHMQSYLAKHDERFFLLPELWLTSFGSMPTYSWFVARLQSFLGSSITGHSICSGGATALALAGVADDVIQAMG
ncbi:hypothetical protein K439DRAFT_1644463 [Ramaria rubella]|nr:hypothetical protein K439DRAFT_1644463 [Ramaria rubella]